MPKEAKVQKESVKDKKGVSSKSKAIEKKDKTAPKTKMTKRFNKLKIKSEDLEKKGIVYIGHLPKGFEEEELKKFFTQFGGVSKLRVSRSKKTGRSKGYAFLEFEDKEVADIAVKTMDGYLMFGKQVQCHMVDAPHKDTFKHGNREWKFVPRQLMFRNKLNSTERTDEQRAERVKGLLEKEKEKRIRLKELGIEYEFPGYSALVGSVPAFSKKQKSAEGSRKSSMSKPDDKPTKPKSKKK